MKCSCKELAGLRKTKEIKACAESLMVSRATICNWLKSCELSKKRRNVNSPFTNKQLEIIHGSLLGDGYLDNRGKYNSRFNKTQCLHNEPYLLWTFEELLPFSESIVDQWTNVICRNNDKIVTTGDKKLQKKYYTVTHLLFAKLRKIWYPNDKKIIPTDLQLTPLTIAVWFADDGSVDHVGRYARFHTDGFNFGEVEFLIELLKQFGINASPWKHYSNFDIGICGDSYDNLMNLIKPFFTWSCFEYKVFNG